MMAQERIQKQKTSRSKETEEVEVKAAEQRDLSDIDALLDEIDGILEENAEEFVKGYVQKGGE